MLWLNPTDNQGARFNLSDVKEGRAGMNRDHRAKQNLLENVESCSTFPHFHRHGGGNGCFRKSELYGGEQ